MSFMLVIVPVFSRDQEALKMTHFYSVAKLEALTDLDGVLGVSINAWIFDTRRSLPAFSRVVYAADESKIQLYVFPLDEAALPHVLSYPRSETLDAFLAS